MAMAAHAWTEPAEHPTSQPESPVDGLGLLVAHLTPEGREMFFTQLGEAAGRSDRAEAVGRVFESWWWSLVIRHDPDFEEHMAVASTLEGRQTAAELRTEVEAYLAAR
jgi:hypothetical protein